MQSNNKSTASFTIIQNDNNNIYEENRKKTKYETKEHFISATKTQNQKKKTKNKKKKKHKSIRDAFKIWINASVRFIDAILN